MKARLFAFLLLFALCLMPVTAQPALPLPTVKGAPTDQWAVQLAPGTDADALAASQGFVNSGQIGTLDGWYLFRAADGQTTDGTRSFGLRSAPGVLQAQQQFTIQRATRGVETHIKDPLFIRQWHINNVAAGMVGEDANVLGAWNFSPLCCDGTGVVVASVDDGVRWKNPDLTPNYNAALSYDFIGNDGDPNGGGHGTAVAGMMAGANDGNQCGVGVAYHANIAGLKILGNIISDAIEADALGHQTNAIHVYNNSWGPSDDGATREKPGPLAQAQMDDSILNGRDGLGTIYVWANGNGLDSFDDSNADGYTNLIYTISVAASDDSGEQSWYSEPGANLLVNAPSNGGSRGITTTGYKNTTCTNSFGGTSSAAPLVGGVVALMLDANPNLTWRDVQYILMQTADLNDPTDTEWAANAAGYMFNPKYGFGRVDAAEAVKYASAWTGVPTSQPRISSGQLTPNLPIPDGTGLGREAGLASTTITIADPMQLEQVEVITNITHARRGDLEVILVSPSGTRSTLMRVRPFDDVESVGSWRYSSNQFWGETATGLWTLEVRDHVTGNIGTLDTWELFLNGISVDPAIVGETADVTTLTGRNVTFEAMSVDMPGTTYQWHEIDGITDPAVPAATSRTLTAVAPVSSSKTYRLTSTTGATSVTSGDFIVTGVLERTLVTAGDMTQNPNRPKEALGWLRLSASNNDKVMCVESECVFRFVGSPAEKTQIRQYLDLKNIDFNAGDFLTFTVQAKGVARGQLKLVVSYSNGTSELCKKAILPTSTFGGFNCILQIDDLTVTEIAAVITNKSKISGQRLSVDNLLVNWSEGAGRSINPALTLPVEPEGFRNGQ